MFEIRKVILAVFTLGILAFPILNLDPTSGTFYGAFEISFDHDLFLSIFSTMYMYIHMNQYLSTSKSVP